MVYSQEQHVLQQSSIFCIYFTCFRWYYIVKKMCLHVSVTWLWSTVFCHEFLMICPLSTSSEEPAISSFNSHLPFLQKRLWKIMKGEKYYKE